MPIITIKAITPLNRNVYRYRTSKPDDYDFVPGQATDLAIAAEGWRDRKRPFTFTSLPEDDDLEFTIKSYPSHDGVTDALSRLVVGDELEIAEPWGTIRYDGPGVFIAGGAGITPFLSILKSLDADPENTDHNTLFFANRTEDDMFAVNELAGLSRLSVHHVLSEDDRPEYLNGRIDRDFLALHISDFARKFYVCGPDAMVKDISKALEDLGAEPDGITFEE